MAVGSAFQSTLTSAGRMRRTQILLRRSSSSRLDFCAASPGEISLRFICPARWAQSPALVDALNAKRKRLITTEARRHGGAFDAARIDPINPNKNLTLGLFDIPRTYANDPSKNLIRDLPGSARSRERLRASVSPW